MSTLGGQEFRPDSSDEKQKADGIVRVSGDIDMFNAEDLRQEILEELSNGNREIVIDLSQAELLDSTAIRTLIAMDERSRIVEKSLRIVNVNRQIGVILAQYKGLDFSPMPERYQD